MDKGSVEMTHQYFSRQSTEALVHAFITGCIDYCNSPKYGLQDCLIIKLQWVQNACARLILREQKFCPITPLVMNYTGCLSDTELSLKFLVF